jgi:hypothetical protein
VGILKINGWSLRGENRSESPPTEKHTIFFNNSTKSNTLYIDLLQEKKLRVQKNNSIKSKRKKTVFIRNLTPGQIWKLGKLWASFQRWRQLCQFSDNFLDEFPGTRFHKKLKYFKMHIFLIWRIDFLKSKLKRCAIKFYNLLSFFML